MTDQRPDAEVDGRSLALTLHPQPLSIARLPAEAAVPDWALATAEPIVSITRTRDELSIVVPTSAVTSLPDMQVEDGWVAIAVGGPLDFALVGILAGLATTLAAAGVSIVAISTFDTDWLLVRAAARDRAVAALRGAGHTIVVVDGA